MPRYVVFTADSSEDQIFCDRIIAKSKKAALEKVVEVRGPATDEHLVADGSNPAAFTAKELRRMAWALERKTVKQLRDEWQETKDSHGGDG